MESFYQQYYENYVRALDKGEQADRYFPVPNIYCNLFYNPNPRPHKSSLTQCRLQGSTWEGIPDSRSPLRGALCRQQEREG